MPIRQAAVFDYEGPAATLVKQIKYGRQLYLAEGAGAFLAAQFIYLKWPMPDVIIPMPMAPLRKWQRGFNQSELLADAVGSLLGCPVLPLLKRKSGGFSQAALSYEQRLKLSLTSFSLKSTGEITDKCVLIIDDVMTTGTTLKCCAEVLSRKYPKSIYSLTVCRSV